MVWQLFIQGSKGCGPYRIEHRHQYRQPADRAPRSGYPRIRREGFA